MAIARAVKDIIRRNPPPPRAVILEQLEEHLAEAGLERRDLAERAGVAYMSLRAFQGGYYRQLASTDLYIREKLSRYLQQHRLRPCRRHAGPPFETRTAAEFARMLELGLRQQKWFLVEAPPGTQKSYLLENFYFARRRAGQRDVAFVEAAENMSPSALLRALGHSLGLHLRGDKDRLTRTFLYDLSLRKRPPLFVIDEGQQLVPPYASGFGAIERLRWLVERSGAGLLIASSHAFASALQNGGGYLWQWMRRFHEYHRLRGLTDAEVVRIAEKYLKRALTEKQRLAFLTSVLETRFGRKAAYYSCGLLWEQLKALTPRIPRDDPDPFDKLRVTPSLPRGEPAERVKAPEGSAL